MSYNAIPINIGTASARAEHAADLGKLIVVDGKMYRLVKAAAAISSAATLVVSTELSSGVPTWNVDLAGTTGCALTHPAGVIPLGQTGSDGGTGLVAGDYFYVQVSGPAKCRSANTAVDSGTLAAATGTAGEVTNATATAAALAASIGVFTETVNTADQTVDVLLRGLV